MLGVTAVLSRGRRGAVSTVLLRGSAVATAVLRLAVTLLGVLLAMSLAVAVQLRGQLAEQAAAAMLRLALAGGRNGRSVLGGWGRRVLAVLLALRRRRPRGRCVMRTSILLRGVIGGADVSVRVPLVRWPAAPSLTASTAISDLPEPSCSLRSAFVCIHRRKCFEANHRSIGHSCCQVW